MKKLIPFAALALLALSCGKTTLETEQPVKQDEPGYWECIPYEGIEATIPGSHSVVADVVPSTKSQLALNGEGTFASVSWTAGDAFRMIAMKGETATTYTHTSYTTATGGSSATFTSGGTFSSDYTVFNCVYPSESFLGFTHKNGKIVLGVEIPRVQTATAGSVAEEANVSYASAASQDDPEIHFKNLAAVLKFRLSGDVVSQVKKVTLNAGSSTVSGGVLFYADATDPSIIDGLHFTGKTPLYSDVSLAGDFAVDTDYYMVVAPCALENFSMTFTNADGSQFTRKFSVKQIVLNRSRITDFGTIALGDAFDNSSSVASLYIEHKNTPNDQYAVITVIPDGYTAGDLGQYEDDAKAAIEALFSVEPYKSYRDYFNVWIMKVASNESGARIYDGTAEEQNKDCFFQSTWEREDYDHMSANADRITSFVKTFCPDLADGSRSINNVPILMLINDGRYGGIAHMYGSGFTYCMAPKTSGKLSWSYHATEAASVTAAPGNTRTVTSAEKDEMGRNSNGDWRNVVVHEFGGHSFGRLADEYWYDSYKDAVTAIEQHSWAVPMALNISASSDASQTPWAELFDTDIQTKMAVKSPLYAQRISVFQGGHVSMFNRWRSEKISCMIDNRFYFSTWQRYLIVNRIMALAGLPAVSVSDFLDNDKPEDPLRDGVGSPVMLPDGVTYPEGRPVPMLPPPVLHMDE